MTFFKLCYLEVAVSCTPFKLVSIEWAPLGFPNVQIWQSYSSPASSYTIILKSYGHLILMSLVTSKYFKSFSKVGEMNSEGCDHNMM